jgi:hypothetical protein
MPARRRALSRQRCRRRRPSPASTSGASVTAPIPTGWANSRRRGRRPDAETNDPVTYPFTTVNGGLTVGQNEWGTRLWDFNEDGAAHYGLFTDWIEDISNLDDGQEVATDMSRGAEAYLQMWERASSAAKCDLGASLVRLLLTCPGKSGVVDLSDSR